jgi:hypothetical protein
MLEANAPILSNVSLAANATSTPIYLEQELMVSIQAVWTGTPTGNFTIETSEDKGATNPDGSITGVTNYNTLENSSLAAGGASGSYTWRFSNVQSRWIRIKYTAASGTGTVNARINLKGA